MYPNKPDETLELAAGTQVTRHSPETLIGWHTLCVQRQAYLEVPSQVLGRETENVQKYTIFRWSEQSLRMPSMQKNHQKGQHLKKNKKTQMQVKMKSSVIRSDLYNILNPILTQTSPPALRAPPESLKLPTSPSCTQTLSSGGQPTTQTGGEKLEDDWSLGEQTLCALAKTLWHRRAAASAHSSEAI